jgi:hypothetical protein
MGYRCVPIAAQRLLDVRFEVLDAREWEWYVPGLQLLYPFGHRFADDDALLLGILAPIILFFDLLAENPKKAFMFTYISR